MRFSYFTADDLRSCSERSTNQLILVKSHKKKHQWKIYQYRFGKLYLKVWTVTTQSKWFCFKLQYNSTPTVEEPYDKAVIFNSCEPTFKHKCSDKIALKALVSHPIFFSAVFTLISTQTTARMSHTWTHTHTHTLDLLHADVGRSLFTTLNLHTLTWPIDTERAALPQSRVKELHENISPPESFKDLTQENTKTNPSMWIPSPP